MNPNLGAITGMTTPATSATPPQPRLVKASHEFEAQMMKELLKPLSSSAGLTGNDDDSDSGSNEALGEFATEALGQALSNHGGLGLSHRIIEDLSRRTSGSGRAAKEDADSGDSLGKVEFKSLR
jgi:Rod binding domain-containing protein